ncbi:collagen-like protein [Legionella pneumophila serogroup 1]|nr:collagen-like protein [Legionella pneumophila]
MNHLKIIGTAGLFMMSCAAQANDKELWAHIEALYSKIGTLQTQINSIPQGAPGPMGPAGPKGEQGPAGTYKAGEGIEISDGEIRTTLSHHIGEEYNGGIVFWVDQTGQHGLIASKTDLNNNEGITMAQRREWQ